MSQDRDGDELGISRQREDCISLIKQRNDWTLAGEYVDNDTSAAGRKPRPQFTAMMADVVAGKIDAIAAWNLDRLSRNRRDDLTLIETCQPRSIVIALVRGTDLDLGTPSGRMVADVLATVARHEIEQKADRQRRAIRQAAEQGRWVGGRRPFGYEADGVTVRKAEADVLREGYLAVLAGESLSSLARQWNEAGLVTGKQGPRQQRTSWQGKGVRDVLLNPRYYGRRMHRGRDMGPAEWPPLVDEVTWRAVEDLLRSPERRVRRGARRLLTGYATCAVCETLVNGSGSNAAGGLYRCRTGRHVSRSVAPVDAYVEEVFLQWASTPAAASALVALDRPDVAGMQEHATVLRRRLDLLAVELGNDPEVSLREYRIASGRVRQQLQEVEAAMVEAGRAHHLAPLLSAADVDAAWGALSVDRKRAALASVFTVRLHSPGRGTHLFRPESVEIRAVDRS